MRETQHVLSPEGFQPWQTSTAGERLQLAAHLAEAKPMQSNHQVVLKLAGDAHERA